MTLIKDPLSKQNREIKEAALKNVSKASLLHKIEQSLMSWRYYKGEILCMKRIKGLLRKFQLISC